MKKNKFLSGVIILSVFGFISKSLGAVYRIPLTYILSSEGMGLYQMVFPLYALLLSISSSGFPASISKLISEHNAKGEYQQARNIFYKSLILLLCFSGFCSVIIFAFGKNIAGLQGNSEAGILYMAISPAIIIVALSSGFKGYFQAYENMVPSSIYMVIEQLGKLVFGILLAKLFIKYGITYAVLGSILGIVLSELVALIYLLLHFIVHKRRNVIVLSGECFSLKKTNIQILTVVIPITFGGIILPISAFIDSSIIINLLTKAGFTSKIATSLFGLSSGVVGSIINMPVVFSLAITTAILPLTSKLVTNKNSTQINNGVSLSLLFNIVVMLPCTIVLYVFSDLIVDLLYGGCLSTSFSFVASELLKYGAFASLYLSIVQVTTGALQGLNKVIVPVISLALGVLIKTIITIVLVRNPEINIFGIEIASCACYGISALFNLIILLKKVKFVYKSDLIKCLSANVLFFAASMIIRKVILDFASGRLAVILIMFISFICLCVLYYMMYRETVNLYLTSKRKNKKQLNKV